ncbi:MAG: SDR family NAD(P)-dependent oxidoreductase [Sandaracinaceae bacterium]|nr:SDR family NAD(P)-dependent oxidoreductase [Sandaracinaceae bacterium]
MPELDGQVALVTGASGGIGAAIARRLARAGARVVATYATNHDAAKELVESIGGVGAGHAALGGDLSDPTAVRDIVEGAHALHGRLDVLVNNAGRYELCKLLEVDIDQWQAHWRGMLETNLLSAANASFYAAKHMARAGAGRIVNIGSRGAFRGEPEAPGYGASKAALHQLTQSLAITLAPHGIGVFAVAPGFVETAMARPHMTGEQAVAIKGQSPFGRVATPDDVAYWVECLASPSALFASGTIVDVNGASYLRT